MILCVPAESCVADVVKVAVFVVVPDKVPVPKEVAPSKNCTVPVAVLGVTVAVKVTVVP